MENENMAMREMEIRISGTSGTSGMKVEVNNEFTDSENIHLVIPAEEWQDLLNMRQFIYDNDLVMKFEMYVDLIAQIEANKELMESWEVIEDEENGDVV